MNIRFVSFESGYEMDHGCKCYISAYMRANKWLENHPKVEVISWQTTALGVHLCITLEYREVSTT